jgi:hypothetical protein
MVRRVDVAHPQHMSEFNLTEESTKPRQFGQEENHATKQQRTTEAHASRPQANQRPEGFETAGPDQGPERGWKEPGRTCFRTDWARLEHTLGVGLS